MNEIEKTRTDEIIILHNEIAGHLIKSMERAIRIGELLTEQKGNLKHGEFTTWIKNNLPFTDRTARNYMRCYENKDKLKKDKLKTETISDLTSAYKLLSEPRGKSAQEEAITEIESLKAKYQINDIPGKESMWKELSDIDLIEDTAKKITSLQSLIKKYNDYCFRRAAFYLYLDAYIGKQLKIIEECDAILTNQ